MLQSARSRSLPLRSGMRYRCLHLIFARSKAPLAKLRPLKAARTALNRETAGGHNRRRLCRHQHSCPPLATVGSPVGEQRRPRIRPIRLSNLTAPHWVGSCRRRFACVARPQPPCSDPSGGIECLGSQYRRIPGQVAASGLNAIVQTLRSRDGGCAILDDRHVSCWSNARFANPEPLSYGRRAVFAVDSPRGGMLPGAR